MAVLIILINVLLGFLAGYLTDLLLRRLGVGDPVKVIVAVIIGLAVAFANIAELLI